MAADEDSIMPTPFCICLENVETGKIETFGSMIQASEFLKRSKQYLQVRIKAPDVKDNTVAVAYDGTKYHIAIYGKGRRKDAGTSSHRFRKPVPEEMRVRMNGNCTNQLCSVCARASGHCPWSHNLTPVEGWTAFPSKISHYRKNKKGRVQNIYTTESWHIIDCPLFLKDAKTIEERREQRKMLDEECGFA